MESIIVALVAGGIALAFAAFMAWRVIGADAGNARMTEIGDAIRAGASAFLRREYMSLLPFVIVVAIVLGVLDLVPTRCSSTVWASRPRPYPTW